MSKYAGVHWIQHAVLRYPLLLVILLILSVEFAVYLLLRGVYKAFEYCLGHVRRNKALKLRLYKAKDYTEWQTAATELDEVEGNNLWKNEEACSLYDVSLIKELIASLVQARTKRNIHELMKTLTHIYSNPNIGGIQNELLYSQCHFGTKYLIEDFLNMVIECTCIVRDTSTLTHHEKQLFFKAACKAYGRTGLLLSGGAAMGYFHLGVMRCLSQAQSLPQVLSGASAGSLMSSFVAVRTDDEIARDLSPEGVAGLFTPADEPFFTKLSRYLRKGHVFDADKWIPKLAPVTLGDTTFLQAFKKTGRILNIITTSTSKYTDSLMCNYKTTPNVCIWSAILASSAMPNLLQAVNLVEMDPITGEKSVFSAQGKHWRDGSIKMDMPQKMLQKQHNVQSVIGCQVNPHALPFFFNSRTGHDMPSAYRAGTPFRGGFAMAVMEKFLKLEMRKWLVLIGELELFPDLFGSDWRFLFTQDLTGQINIIPRAKLMHYVNLLSDPDEEAMADYFWRGERATWAVLPRIMNRYRLEALLQDALKGVMPEQPRFELAEYKKRLTAAEEKKNKEKATAATTTTTTSSVTTSSSNPSKPRQPSEQHDDSQFPLYI